MLHLPHTQSLRHHEVCILAKSKTEAVCRTEHGLAGRVDHCRHTVRSRGRLQEAAAEGGVQTAEGPAPAAPAPSSPAADMGRPQVCLCTRHVHKSLGTKPSSQPIITIDNLSQGRLPRPHPSSSIRHIPKHQLRSAIPLSLSVIQFVTLSKHCSTLESHVHAS